MPEPRQRPQALVVGEPLNRRGAHLIFPVCQGDGRQLFGRGGLERGDPLARCARQRGGRAKQSR